MLHWETCSVIAVMGTGFYPNQSQMLCPPAITTQEHLNQRLKIVPKNKHTDGAEMVQRATDFHISFNKQENIS